MYAAGSKVLRWRGRRQDRNPVASTQPRGSTIASLIDCFNTRPVTRCGGAIAIRIPISLARGNHVREDAVDAEASTAAPAADRRRQPVGRETLIGIFGHPSELELCIADELGSKAVRSASILRRRIGITMCPINIRSGRARATGEVDEARVLAAADRAAELIRATPIRLPSGIGANGCVVGSGTRVKDWQPRPDSARAAAPRLTDYCDELRLYFTMVKLRPRTIGIRIARVSARHSWCVLEATPRGRALPKRSVSFRPALSRRGNNLKRFEEIAGTASRDLS